MVYLMEKMRVEHLDSTKAVSMVENLVFQKVVLTDNWKVFELVVWKDNYWADKTEALRVGMMAVLMVERLVD